MCRDEVTCDDIRRACVLIGEFVHGQDEACFQADAKTQSAVLHQLLIIGEAVRRLSTGFRERHPDIPWHAIAGMRNQIIHGYDSVDLQEVYRTAEKDIPDLLKRLRRIGDA
jgi:uncharacterized protein with HEPN domain